MKLAHFCQIPWLMQILKSDTNLSILTALQPWVMLQKIFSPLQPWLKVAKRLIWWNFLIKFTCLMICFFRNGVQNDIFMEKFHEISLFATVSHGCKGEKIICNHDSWLQRIFFSLQPWLTVAKRLISWDFPIIFVKNKMISD